MSDPPDCDIRDKSSPIAVRLVELKSSYKLKIRVMTPPVGSLPRLTTLLASLLVALGSGTNYVYSAYSPQLGSRLGISHTQLNIVGSAGNLGVYVSGPIWGKIVDSRGPRILLACAFSLLLTGYLGMRSFYNAGLPKGVDHLSTISFLVLALFSLLTGAGGNSGFAGAVNSTAKSFPDKTRASTTGLVISGYGLSAFFFSTIAHVFFPGDTTSLFLVLALGTSIPMIIGFFLVRPIPLPQEGLADEEEEEALVTRHHNLSESHLLDHDFIEPRPHDTELSRESRGLQTNLYGKQLFKSIDFWLLFSLLSILSGTGLMYINNVGSMSQILYAYTTPPSQYDPATAAGWQAAQVSTISLSNFVGRIFIGLIADYAKHTYSLPRSYNLTLVSLLFCLSQLVTSSINDISHLWIASSLLGLAYGSVFSLFPTVCLEWFGMPHFSENWGYMCTSPIFAGNLFSLVFGYNLDQHSPPPSSALPTPASSNLRIRSPSTSPSFELAVCTLGKTCYVSTIYLTTLATFTAILLSLYAGWRDRCRQMQDPWLAKRRETRRVEEVEEET